jgi:hypothetical protein
MPHDAKVVRLRRLYVVLHDKIAFGGASVTRGGMSAQLDDVEDAIRAAWEARRLSSGRKPAAKRSPTRRKK